MAAMAREPPIYCSTRASFAAICKGKRTMRRMMVGENENDVWKHINEFYARTGEEGGPFAIYTEWQGDIFKLELIE
jgi:hypothetical protein